MSSIARLSCRKMPGKNDQTGEDQLLVKPCTVCVLYGISCLPEQELRCALSTRSVARRMRGLSLRHYYHQHSIRICTHTGKLEFNRTHIPAYCGVTNMKELRVQGIAHLHVAHEASHPTLINMRRDGRPSIVQRSVYIHINYRQSG